MVLSRAGLWSVQHPSFARCLGAIGLRLDYKAYPPPMLRDLMSVDFSIAMPTPLGGALLPWQCAS